MELYAQYEDQIVDAKTLAQIRGKGLYGRVPCKTKAFNSGIKLPKYDPVKEFAEVSNKQCFNSREKKFFSVENLLFIQRRITEEVEKVKGIRIKPQDPVYITQIMNRYYNRPMRIPATVHLGSGGIPNDKEYIANINKHVIDVCVDQIISGIEIYKDYWKHSSQLPVPLDYPKLETMKGSRIIYDATQFLRKF